MSSLANRQATVPRRTAQTLLLACIVYGCAGEQAQPVPPEDAVAGANAGPAGTGAAPPVTKEEPTAGAGPAAGAAPTAGIHGSGGAGAGGEGGNSGEPAGVDDKDSGTGRDSDAGPDGAGMPGGDWREDFVEDHRDECPIGPMPSVDALPEQAALPDPFTMMDGTPVTTLAQWRCRREEIAAMLEHYELGDKPRHPDSVTGSLSGNTFTIQVNDAGQEMRFTVQLRKPAGPGPFPVVIGYIRVNLGGALGDLPVATIDYTTGDLFNKDAPNQMAKDGSAYRGQGLFYDLYGSDHSAGALMAWAWGTSRIIDALIATPEAGIDPRRIAVTGCSRYGKGALVAGAFDQRIALTIPEEAGSGGASAWRGIAHMKSLGEDIEMLSNVAGGTNWFRSSFARDFSDATINRIPYDHHQLAGLVAPRGLLSLEQASIAWLGPGASHINNVGTREIFLALDAEQEHTYSLNSGNEHCALPSNQHHWVRSYVQKHLLDQQGEPAAIETPPGFSVERDRWIDWATPTLR